MEDRSTASIGDTGRDLWDLLVAYAKQETVDPLRNLGRYVGFGVGGALLLGIGLIELSVAGLRALQTETGSTFTGSWSWAPYGIVLVAVVLVAIGTVSLIGRRGRDDRPSDD